MLGQHAEAQHAGLRRTDAAAGLLLLVREAETVLTSSNLELVETPVPDCTER